MPRPPEKCPFSPLVSSREKACAPYVIPRESALALDPKASPWGVSRTLCASPRCGVRARRTEVFVIAVKNRDRWRRRSLRRRDRGRRLKRADGRVVMPARFFALQSPLYPPFTQGGQDIEIASLYNSLNSILLIGKASLEPQTIRGFSYTEKTAFPRGGRRRNTHFTAALPHGSHDDDIAGGEFLFEVGGEVVVRDEHVDVLDARKGVGHDLADLGAVQHHIRRLRLGADEL